MSAWNGNMDYAFNERSFSREDNGNLSRQMFIREGGLKHYTDIRSNNILTSLSVDYNLHRLMNLYVEAGYGGELAFCSGCIFNLGKMKIYLPLITEKGLFIGEKFHEGIRLQIQKEFDINELFFRIKNHSNEWFKKYICLCWKHLDLQNLKEVLY